MRSFGMQINLSFSESDLRFLIGLHMQEDGESCLYLSIQFVPVRTDRGRQMPWSVIPEVMRHRIIHIDSLPMY